MSDGKIVKLDWKFDDSEETEEVKAARAAENSAYLNQPMPELSAEEIAALRNASRGSPDDAAYEAYLEAEHWLGELLACLHGDGGHYQGDHGIEKATKDAIATHYEQVKALDELQNERDCYRAALEKIVEGWTGPAFRAFAIARETIAKADKEKL